MPAKKKATELSAPAELAARKNTGAPANLRRLEIHEEDAEKEVNGLKERLKSFQELLVENGDDEEQKPIREQIASLRMQLDSAYDLWFKLSKQVRDFDKSVKEARREGEQIPTAEAREIFAQLMLSIDLALERTIIADAQSAALCDSPEAFHVAHSENYRSAKTNALEIAVSDGVLPKWIL